MENNKTQEEQLFNMIDKFMENNIEIIFNPIILNEKVTMRLIVNNELVHIHFKEYEKDQVQLAALNALIEYDDFLTIKSEFKLIKSFDCN